jgi:hypothetical protein
MLNRLMVILSFISGTFSVLIYTVLELVFASPIPLCFLNKKGTAVNINIFIKNTYFCRYRPGVIFRLKSVEGWRLNIYNSHSYVRYPFLAILVYQNDTILLKSTQHNLDSILCKNLYFIYSCVIMKSRPNYM